jgi:hypothetical protein
MRGMKAKTYFEALLFCEIYRLQRLPERAVFSEPQVRRKPQPAGADTLHTF